VFPRVLIASALLASAASGCGGAQAHSEAPRASLVEPAAFLEELGGEASPVLRRPERSVDAIDAARREARGTERRQLMRDLAVALMYVAQASDGREGRRARQRAEQTLDAAARGNRDAQLGAELDFVKLWMDWRAGSRSARARAERYTTRHRRVGGALLTIAWMIRGEAALAEEAYDDATEAYRFALGQLGSPVYAFALLRTAHAERGAGHAEEATQALTEVEQLGCEAGVHALVLRAATAAAGERGSGLRTDPDGVTRPASCPSPSERAEEEGGGWHPAE
jgi:hypothetical protein